MGRVYSDVGLELTKSFEGLRLRSYQDSGGVWTVGYGHVGAEAAPGRCITEPEAAALLRRDVEVAVCTVNAAVTRELAQHEFDALVDFCFNVGCGAFRRASVLLCANAGDGTGVQGHLREWVKIGGKPSPGLARRRAAECAMWRGDGWRRATL